MSTVNRFHNPYMEQYKNSARYQQRRADLIAGRRRLDNEDLAQNMSEITIRALRAQTQQLDININRVLMSRNDQDAGN